MKLFIYLLVPFFVCTALEAYIEKTETPLVKYLKPIELAENSSGFPGVDCMYVINLDQRLDRWERTKRFLNDLGCFPNRVSAVNGWSIPNWLKVRLAGPYSVHMDGGPIGCLLSHVSIYKDAFDRGFDTVWICEDDIEIVGNLEFLAERLKELKEIDPSWDILYTDYTVHGVGCQSVRPGQSLYQVIEEYVNSEHTLAHVHGRCRNHSIIFSKNGIRKVMDYFSHVYIWSPIDIDIHYVPGIREYTVMHDIVTSIKSISDSDTERGSRFFKN
jgi:hypothetical protein